VDNKCPKSFGRRPCRRLVTPCRLRVDYGFLPSWPPLIHHSLDPRGSAANGISIGSAVLQGTFVWPIHRHIDTQTQGRVTSVAIGRIRFRSKTVKLPWVTFSLLKYFYLPCAAINFWKKQQVITMKVNSS